MSKELEMLDQVKHKLKRLEEYEQFTIDMHLRLAPYCMHDIETGVIIFNPNKSIDDLLQDMFQLGVCTSYEKLKHAQI